MAVARPLTSRPKPRAPPPAVGPGAEELYVGGRVVCHTDGASEDNQDAPLRRAGYGVYFGPGHPRDLAEKLTGAVQTNRRAELQAAVRALDWKPGH